ncbi:MAG: serine kinase [Synergistaceae bacterium]|nr:serine kinase [Synergistaceae bacterium]
MPGQDKMPGKTISEICEALNATVHVAGDESKTVERAAVGDLLSFVMGGDSDGAAWITIQTHLNVAAVAVLKEMPMIIIAAGRVPAADLTARCEEENITLVTSPDSIFGTCATLGRLGLEG